jgi:hypothetical protein
MEYLVPQPKANRMDRQISPPTHIREADPKILKQTTANPYNNPTTRVERTLSSIQNITTNKAAMDTQMVILMDTNRQEPGLLENFNGERMPPMRRG